MGLGRGYRREGCGHGETGWGLRQGAFYKGRGLRWAWAAGGVAYMGGVGERGAWLGKMGVSSDPTPISSRCRNDEKTAADYKIQGGSVLHLVLALRGGGAGR